MTKAAPTPPAETPYLREEGYAESYRDDRFQRGTGRGTHSRESRAIQTALGLCAPSSDARWLDAPCGAGRLTGLLPPGAIQADRDYSMVHAAPPGRLRVCASLHSLPFADRAFDGALCMRLLHHIPSSEERRHILRELRRVSRGPVVLSFFHSVSLQHARRVVARRLGKRRSGRCAVRWAVFRADLEAAGFRVQKALPLARFLSEQWIVVVRPDGGDVATS